MDLRPRAPRQDLEEKAENSSLLRLGYVCFCPSTQKQAPKNAIGVILWLDENLAGLLLIESRYLGKEECTDEVIENQLTSGDCTNPTYRGGLTMSVDPGRPEGAGPRSE
jgi:hypothetical protein